MNKKQKSKDFDCLDYKYKVQNKIYNKIRNMSNKEEIDYFNSKVIKGSFYDLISNSGVSV